ncbi:glycoside hydrolase family 47 protein [Pholiota conissans]|uniref:alpha-1,2-Mannosidase n=1 Tax=Pholiota conissans TaxID=109636 RepID=A0A9P5Z5D8_9AGAR|nr:glycoside hydrolase family 47 protein [Pholiota conissans]
MLRFSKSRLLALTLAGIILLAYIHWIGLLDIQYRKDDLSEEWSEADNSDWTDDTTTTSIPETTRKPPATTHIETESEAPETPVVPNLAEDAVKRDAIVEAFKHAWSAYERDAMGDDEYHPISRRGSNLNYQGGVGFTVVDAIDTMQIMGLMEEYKRAREWIAHNLTFERDGNFNTFETTIRVLGGLLSAYHFSDQDPLFLEKAIDLGDRITTAFDTPSGLPLSDVNLKLRRGVKGVAPTSTAEASTLQLELRYLSVVTKNETYWRKAEHAMKVIRDAKMPEVVVPIFMNADTGQFQISEIRMGSRGDSYYEYLLKQYLQTNKTEQVYLEMYEETMNAIHTTLIRKGLVNGLTYTIELLPEHRPQQRIMWKESHKQDHLVCFLGGSLMLGAATTGTVKGTVSIPPKREELTAVGKADWKLGLDLIETCVDTYMSTETGLSPEIVYFWDEEKEAEGKERDWYIKGNSYGRPSYDARYILRPETVESLFIAFRLTGDVKYREYGWKIFQAIQKHCRIATGGYASVLDVDNKNTEMIDKMETFFLSETLKYLYLLFSDSREIPLNEYVFNTEAHPLPIFNPTIKTAAF